jgi:hypothetical protein
MNRFVLNSAALLVLAQLAVVVGSGRVSATDPPNPDLTGGWWGSASDPADPNLLLPAVLEIKTQKGSRVAGTLSIGRAGFVINGQLVNNELVLRNTDPPQPDMPAIEVRGTIVLVDPPNPDKPAILVLKAEYVMVWADGSTARGVLELAQE